MNKKEIAFILLLLLVISIPFPDYSLVSKAIIFLAAWNLFTWRKTFFSVLWTQKTFFFSVSLLFWLSLAGLLWTDHLIEGLVQMKRWLPLIVIPATIFPMHINKNKYHLLSVYFSLAVSIAFGLGLLFFFFFKWMHWGNYAFYQEFSLFLNRHTTYFSLFAAIVIIHALYFFLNTDKNRIKYLIFIFISLLIMFTLASRIAWAALLLASFILIIKTGRPAAPQKRLFLFFFLLTIFASAVIVLQKRNPLEKFGQSSTDYVTHRIIHWKSVWETGKKHLIRGYGTGANRQDLWDIYKRHGLQNAWQEKYNAHNQFLEIFFDFGLTGVILFIISLIFLYKKIRLCPDEPLGIALLTLFVTFMLTESILLRLSGIVSYALWLTLFYNTCKNEKGY